MFFKVSKPRSLLVLCILHNKQAGGEVSKSGKTKRGTSRKLRNPRRR